MKLDIKETLNFFDQAQKSGGHASAIIGVIGEEMNALIFKHFLESDDKKVKILDHSVTQGTKKGKRLDRWILVGPKDNKYKELYQVEIKNWSATAIRGISLGINAGKEEIKEVSLKNWEGQVDELSKDYKKSTTAKTLKKMKPPEQYKNLKIKPLLIFWMVISKDGDSKSYSSIRTKPLKLKFESDFDTLNIFSVSLYLRELLDKGVDNIELLSKKIEERIEILNKIIKK